MRQSGASRRFFEEEREEELQAGTLWMFFADANATARGTS
jgi:hypothetical protein